MSLRFSLKMPVADFSIAMALVAAIFVNVFASANVCAQTTGSSQTSAPASPPAFQDSTITLANGIVGRAVSFVSANPRTAEDIIQHREMPAVTLHAKLFFPHRAGRVPAVIIAPGSGGVSQSMVAHANALTEHGFAVMLIDPFGGRGIRDTIAAQGQLSWSASSYDVLAALRSLQQESGVDSARIGAMGYSRGGLAVLEATMTPLVDATLGPGKALRAALVGWPYCGRQFLEPRTAPTAVRFVLGDIDNWVGTAQCQAYFNGMKARNPAVSMRIFRNADHGFGYQSPQVREIPNAMKALNAPIVYFDERGTVLDPWSGEPLPGADDRTFDSSFQPFISRGVRAGTKDNQAAEFAADFLAFFDRELNR